MPDLVRALKFADRPRIGFSLGNCAAELAGAAGKMDLVSWVPLGKKRFSRRGYNQAEQIARGYGAVTGIAARPLIRRVRDTDPQAKLARGERRRNVAGAFLLLDGVQISGKKVVLVDDVYTTGATTAGCARCLLEGGAAEVVVLTAAAG